MPKKGYIQTPEHRLNATLARKDNTGKYERTEEIRNKLRLINLGKKYSEETKKKLSLMRKGVPKSKEHIAKIAEATKHRNSEIKEKVSMMMSLHNKRLGMKQRGSNNPNWKGGFTKYYYTRKYVMRLKSSLGDHYSGDWFWIKRLFDYTCPSCGKQEPEIKLTKDHIIPLVRSGTDYIYNIQPLCKRCNSKKRLSYTAFPKCGERSYA